MISLPLRALFLAAALTVARCLDFGLSPADASALVTARVTARARKAA